jgi:hypothetical protein
LLCSLDNLYCWTLCHYTWTGQGSSLPSMDVHETPAKKNIHNKVSYVHEQNWYTPDSTQRTISTYMFNLNLRLLKKNKLRGVTRCDQMECTYFSVLSLCDFAYLSDIYNYNTDILHKDCDYFLLYLTQYTQNKKNSSNKSYRP